MTGKLYAPTWWTQTESASCHVSDLQNTSYENLRQKATPNRQGCCAAKGMLNTDTADTDDATRPQNTKLNCSSGTSVHLAFLGCYQTSVSKPCSQRSRESFPRKHQPPALQMAYEPYYQSQKWIVIVNVLPSRADLWMVFVDCKFGSQGKHHSGIIVMVTANSSSRNS